MLRTDTANHFLGMRLNVWTVDPGLPRRADLLPAWCAGPQEYLVPAAGDGESGAQRRTRRVPGGATEAPVLGRRGDDRRRCRRDGAAVRWPRHRSRRSRLARVRSAEASSVNASAAEAGAAGPEGDTGRGRSRTTRPRRPARRRGPLTADQR